MPNLRTSTGTNKMRKTNAMYLKRQRLIAETDTHKETHRDKLKDTQRDPHRRITRDTRRNTNKETHTQSSKVYPS